VNEGKSSFYVEDTSGDLIHYLSQLFNIQANPLRNGTKYFGFKLKTSAYRMEDWSWIIDRLYKKITAWENLYLSKGGRMTLTQAVLV